MAIQFKRWLWSGGMAAGLLVATAAATETRYTLDQWGLSEAEWRTLDGPVLRYRARATDRKDEILAAADRGDAKAMLLAGGALTDGWWGAADVASGRRYLERAASLGATSARSRLCGLQLGKPLNDADRARGSAACEAAAAEGDPIAMSTVGWAKAQSEDPKISLEGRRLLKMAAEAGTPGAQGLLASALWARGEKSEAIQQWKAAADQEERWSLYVLGTFYRDGTEGFEKDPDLALDYLGRSAELMSSEGIGAYADLLTDMNDKVTSSHWAEIGAERGDLRLMQMWSARLRFGVGVEQDGYAAIEWYKKILPLDPKYAGELAGDMLANGIDGVEKDIPTAKKWFEVAALKGSGSAAKKLANIAIREDDLDGALKWSRMSAATGDADGKKLLAALLDYQKKTATEQQKQQATVGPGYVQSSAKKQSNGGPSAREIVSVTTATQARYHTEQSTTSQPGELVVSSLFGEMYRIYHNVDNVSCVKSNATTFKCSYRLSNKFAKADGDGFLATIGNFSASLMNAVGGDYTVVRSDVFVKKKSGGWSSATFDAAVKRQVASNSRGQSYDDILRDGRAQAHEDTRKNEQRVNDFMYDWYTR